MTTTYFRFRLDSGGGLHGLVRRVENGTLELAYLDQGSRWVEDPDLIGYWVDPGTGPELVQVTEADALAVTSGLGLALDAPAEVA